MCSILIDENVNRNKLKNFLSFFGLLNIKNSIFHCSYVHLQYKHPYIYIYIIKHIESLKLRQEGNLLCTILSYTTFIPYIFVDLYFSILLEIYFSLL